MNKKIKMTIYLILGTGFLIYTSLAIIIYLSQSKLLYHPGENNYLEENNLNHKIEKISIPSDNKLIAWHFKKNENYKTLLFFHGNAGKLDNRIYKLNELSKLNINYLIFAYRGFSGNEGSPDENGLYKDARAVKYYLNLQNIPDKKIVLYGESLGTAIAIDVAKDHNFSGIILESPFTSMVSLAKRYYPYLPVSILLKDKYETIKKIKQVNSPILVMHGRKDKIVPFEMGEKIFKYSNKPKYSFFIDNDDHMMEFSKELIKSIELFLESLN